jgi:hypothetical protein
VRALTVLAGLLLFTNLILTAALWVQHRRIERARRKEETHRYYGWKYDDN